MSDCLQALCYVPHMCAMLCSVSALLTSCTWSACCFVRGVTHRGTHTEITPQPCMTARHLKKAGRRCCEVHAVYGVDGKLVIRLYSCQAEHIHLQAQQPRLSRGEGTHAVILAPTRELCLQIHDVLSMLLRRYHWLVHAAALTVCKPHCRPSTNM